MTTGVEIDWKTRFERSVSDAIEAKAAAHIKLQEKMLELDQANTKIRSLETQVRKLKPAGDKLKAAEEGRRLSDSNWAARVNDLKTTLQEKDARIQFLNRALARDQRGVIEDVIVWLRGRADKMPDSLPKDPVL